MQKLSKAQKKNYMKTTILLSLILCFSVSLQAQFSILQTSTAQNLKDVHFINAQMGYAVGDTGSMVKTLDGGNTWTTLNLNTTENLTKVQFINNNLGFVLSDTILFKTTDGGMNFTPQVFNETLKDIHFISATEGKIAGYKNGAVVLSTTDGGANFTPMTVEASWYVWDSINGIGIGNYYTLDCIDYSNGQWEIGGSNYDYNGGEYPYSLYSTNGTQWTERYLDLNLSYGDSDARILDVQTSSNGTVYHLKSTGSDKTYLYENDWKKLITTPSEYLNKMSEFGILNDTVLFIPTNGKLRTYNTNNSPFEVTEQDISGITLTGGVGMVNTTIGFFTGEDGKLLKYTDLASSIERVDEMNVRVFPNPASDYLSFEMENIAAEIDVLDVNGRVILTNIELTNFQMDVSILSSGVYFVKIKSENESVLRKFVKQ